MTTKEVIALAKEKLGRDITEQEAQDFLEGKAALPDEALAVAAGGTNCDSKKESTENGSHRFLGELGENIIN